MADGDAGDLPGKSADPEDEDEATAGEAEPSTGVQNDTEVAGLSGADGQDSEETQPEDASKSEDEELSAGEPAAEGSRSSVSPRQQVFESAVPAGDEAAASASEDAPSNSPIFWKKFLTF